MKTPRFLIGMLALMLILTLPGCGKAGKPGSTEPSTEPTTISAESTDSVETEPTKPVFLMPAPVPGLSELRYTFRVAFGQTVVQLPCPVSELEQFGYSFDDTLSAYMEPGYTAAGNMSVNTDDGQKIITVSLYNNSDEVKHFRDCMVEAVYLTKDSEIPEYPIQICLGITFGCSVEQVKAIYGEPVSEYESDGYVDLFYNDGILTHRLKFSFYEDTLYEIDVCTEVPEPLSTDSP